MKKQHIIGMFDSGVGGLTVMKQILAELPDVRIVYFGDTARVPYGNRTTEELIRFGEEIVTFLISQGAEAIVVACNTSSATALPVLKERYAVPLIGTIEPGARLAVESTSKGKIGLVATEATVKSKAYPQAVSKALAKGIVPCHKELAESWHNGEEPISLIKSQACPLFVPLIEAGLANSVEARNIAQTYVAPLQNAGVDTVILGCTHYPFLAPVIQDLMGPEVTLVDPSFAVVEELKLVLRELEDCEGHSAETKHTAGVKNWKMRYFVSGDPELFRQVGNTLMAEKIENVTQIAWEG